MGLFNKGRKKRKAREEAARQEAEAREANRLARERLAAEIETKNQEIDQQVAIAQQQLREHYDAELAKATNFCEGKKQEYANIKQELNAKHANDLQELSSRYEARLGRLDEIFQQAKEAMQQNYGSQLQELSKQLKINNELRNQAAAKEEVGLRNEVLVDANGLQQSYKQLIDPTTINQQKVKLYTKIIAWINGLEQQHLIITEQQQRISKFLHAVAFSSIAMEGDDFKKVDQEVEELLVLEQQKHLTSLHLSYQGESDKLKNEYGQNKDVVTAGTTILEQKTAEIERQYNKEKEFLEEEKKAQQQQLQKNLDFALQALEQEIANLATDYQQYNQELTEEKEQKLAEIEQRQVELKSRLQTEKEVQLRTVDESLARVLTSISHQLQAKLRSIRHSFKAKIFNLISAPLSLAGAWLAPSLLAGVSSTVVSSVQSSLLATGVGSLARMLGKGEGSIGFDFKLNLGQKNGLSDFNFSRFSVDAINRDHQEKFDLAAFKEQYAERTRKILTLQNETESKLLAQMLSPVALFKSQAAQLVKENAQLEVIKTAQQMVDKSSSGLKAEDVKKILKKNGKQLVIKSAQQLAELAGRNIAAVRNVQQGLEVLKFSGKGLQALGIRQSNGGYNIFFRAAANPELGYKIKLTAQQANTLQQRWLARSTSEVCHLKDKKEKTHAAQITQLATTSTNKQKRSLISLMQELESSTTDFWEERFECRPRPGAIDIRPIVSVGQGRAFAAGIDNPDSSNTTRKVIDLVARLGGQAFSFGGTVVQQKEVQEKGAVTTEGATRREVLSKDTKQVNILDVSTEAFKLQFDAWKQSTNALYQKSGLAVRKPEKLAVESEAQVGNLSVRVNKERCLPIAGCFKVRAGLDVSLFGSKVEYSAEPGKLNLPYGETLSFTPRVRGSFSVEGNETARSGNEDKDDKKVHRLLPKM